MTLKRSIQPPPEAPFQVSLGPARFYLDEIRDIYNALVDFSTEYANKKTPAVSPGSVEIRALTAKADDFDDLKEATRSELKHITLILSLPKIRVNLWSHDAVIIAESESADTASFAENIRSFVRGRRSLWVPLRLRIVASLIPVWILAIALYFVPYSPSSWGLYARQGIGRYSFVEAIFFTVMVATSTGAVYVRSFDTIKVSPIWRKEQRGISAQTRTAIIVGLICAIAAGVISFWAGVFVHN